MAIKIKPSHKGLLHKKLGVAKGKKIPAGKIAKAAHSNNAATRKQAIFAMNARGWKHPKKRKSGKGAQHMNHKEFNSHKAWSK